MSEESLAIPSISKAVEQAIADLRYGTIALNGPGTWGIYTMIAPFPDATVSLLGNCEESPRV